MDPYIIPWQNYIIEIFEHPIYHDFEYVVKNKEGKVVTASMQQYEIFEDCEVGAKMAINILL